MTSEEAAVAVGASQAAGSRWFRVRGGMPTFLRIPVSGRYLSFEEREEIALLKAQDAGGERSPVGSAVIPRPSPGAAPQRATRGGRLDYRVSAAQWKAELMAQRP